VFRFPPLTPFIKKTMIVLAGAFILTILLEALAGIPVATLLALSGEPGLPWLWQVFTHVLVYPVTGSAVMSFAIDLIFLWLMGAPFEAQHGARPTAYLFGISTIATGLGGALAALFLPTVVFGMGPLIWGLIIGFAAITGWNARVSFFGVIPMRAWHIVALFGAISVFSNLADRNFGAIVAEIAGALAAYGYLKWYTRPRKPKKAKFDRPTIKRVGRRFEVVEGGKAGEDDRPKWLN
jgi:membrane associated rhomboid family serine protease